MLVDCTRAPPKGKKPGFREYDGYFDSYTGGCDGGWTTLSNDFFAKLGWMFESDYPYTARDGTC